MPHNVTLQASDVVSHCITVLVCTRRMFNNRLVGWTHEYDHIDRQTTCFLCIIRDFTS